MFSLQPAGSYKFHGVSELLHQWNQFWFIACKTIALVCEIKKNCQIQNCKHSYVSDPFNKGSYQKTWLEIIAASTVLLATSLKIPSILKFLLYAAKCLPQQSSHCLIRCFSVCLVSTAENYPGRELIRLLAKISAHLPLLLKSCVGKVVTFSGCIVLTCAFGFLEKSKATYCISSLNFIMCSSIALLVSD